MFVFETPGRADTPTRPNDPRCDDWFSLLVKPGQQGRLEVKIAVQADGTGKGLRQWLMSTDAVTAHSLAVDVPAKDLQRLRDSITAHLAAIKFEAKAKPARLGWVVLVAVFVLGLIAGAGSRS